MFSGGVDDLDMRATADRLQSLQIGNHDFAQRAEEIWSWGVTPPCSTIGMRAVILDVDNQQRCVSWINGHLAAQCVH
jgi:hypothetical protein